MNYILEFTLVRPTQCACRNILSLPVNNSVLNHPISLTLFRELSAAKAAMFENLHAFLQVESNPLEKQRFVHINSTVEGSGFANSSFLIHYFISSFIKQGHKVS